MEFLPLSKHSRYVNFPNLGSSLLIQTIENFLSVKVTLIPDSVNSINDKVKQDIRDNIKRNLYEINPTKMILVSTASDEDRCYCLGIVLEGKNLIAISSNKILNTLANKLSKHLEECMEKRFYNSPSLLDENLIQRTIENHLSSKGYNRHYLSYIIDKFNALRTTTFEGKYFSSGIILSKCLHEFTNGREGKIRYLTKQRSLLEELDRRFWYMCDGIDNYFLSDLKSGIKSIYISNDGRSPMQKMLLPDFMHNNDVILRVYGGRELSIITNEGLEFIYQENCWKLRDYMGIKMLVQKEVKLTDNVLSQFYPM